MKNAATILLVVCAFSACGGEKKQTETDTLAAPQQPIASIDTKKFEQVQRAGQGIRSAVDLGSQVARYRELLQVFDQEVALARDNATNDPERKVAAAYADALSIYKDALTLWNLKFTDENKALRAMAAQSLEATGKVLPGLADSGSCPFVPNPALTAVMARYGISTTKDEMGMERVAVDKSLKLIWQKGSESLSAANKALHAG